MNIIPGFSNIEKSIKKYSLIFALIVLYQGLFGGMSVQEKPKRLDAISNNLFFKLITMTSIAFTATQDIETSILSVLIFLIILYLIKTPKEREGGPLDF